MHAPAHNLAEFEKELARQTLISERSRCSLLAGALGLLLGVMIIYSVALAGTPGALPGITGVTIVVAFAALFEFGTSLRLTHLLRTGRTRPPFAPYRSTFIETALPTCAMLIVAHTDTPHSAINSAAPYGYPVMPIEIGLGSGPQTFQADSRLREARRTIYIGTEVRKVY